MNTRLHSKGHLWFVKSSTVEKYNVWVCGVQVTSANEARVLNWNLWDRGRVSFNPSSSVLTIRDCHAYNNLLDYPTFLFKQSATLSFYGNNDIYTANDHLVADNGATVTIVNGGSDNASLKMTQAYKNNGHNGGVILKNRSKLVYKNNGQGKTACWMRYIQGDGSSTALDVQAPLTLWGGEPNGGATVSVGSIAYNGMEANTGDDALCTISGGAVLYNGSAVTGKVAFVEKGTTVVKPTAVTLSSTSVELSKIGEQRTITADVAPTNATDKTVSWSSSNDDVVTVGANGELTAVSNGTATVTATTSNDKAATCQVTVRDREPVSITLSETNILIDRESVTGHFLTATILPAEAAPVVTWLSSDENVARADFDYVENGKACLRVDAVGEGTCSIIARTSNGIETTCEVVIHYPVKAQSIELDQHNVLLTEIGQTVTLRPTVSPENAEGLTYWIDGGNPSVATLSDDLTLTAVGEGYTGFAVWATYNGDLMCYDEIRVKVKVPVLAESIKVTADAYQFYAFGETTQMRTAIEPANADVTDVKWESSDESVATVDGDGLVTAVGIGTCSIKAITTDGTDLSASWAIEVCNPDDYDIKPATDIKLNRTEMTLFPRQTFDLQAMLEPTDANVFLEWDALDSEGRSVDPSYGGVMYYGIGTPRQTYNATVTAGDWPGEFTVVVHPKDEDSPRAECKVTVADNIYFSARNADGVLINYSVTNLDPDNMQCEVYGNSSSPAVASNTSGKVVIPAQVEYEGNTYWVAGISEYAFYACSALTEVEVPEGVACIGSYAFQHNGNGNPTLHTVTLPSSLKMIGRDCFDGQTALATVRLGCTEPPISYDDSPSGRMESDIEGASPFDNIADEAVLYVPDGTYDLYKGDGITNTWSKWFSRIEETDTHKTEFYFTEMEANGFEVSYLVRNMASNTCEVRGTEEMGFVNRAVDTESYPWAITIPEKAGGYTVTAIGENAFMQVQTLQEVRLPKTIQTIGRDAFLGCSILTSVYVKSFTPPTVTDSGIFVDIDENATLYVPAGYGKDYKTWPWTDWFGDNIEETDTYFEEDSEGSDDVSVAINYHVTSPEEMTCEVSLNPENGSQAVGYDAVEVVIPAEVNGYAVTAIGSSAFEALSNLSKVTLPATIETIGYAAFNQCTSLSDVYILAEQAPTLLDINGLPTEDDNFAFAGLPMMLGMARAMGNNALDYGQPATLHVPEGCLENYQKSPWTGWFFTIIDDITPKVDKDPADVNGDGSVDVADIASVIDVMAGNTVNADAADTNHDGMVDVADIATIIDRMAALARKQRMVAEK